MNKCTSKIHLKPLQYSKLFDVFLWHLILTSGSLSAGLCEGCCTFTSPVANCMQGWHWITQRPDNSLWLAVNLLSSSLTQMRLATFLCMDTKMRIVYFLFFLNIKPSLSLSLTPFPLTISSGWTGLPRGPGERHGVMAVLIFRVEA